MNAGVQAAGFLDKRDAAPNLHRHEDRMSVPHPSVASTIARPISKFPFLALQTIPQNRQEAGDNECSII